MIESVWMIGAAAVLLGLSGLPACLGSPRSATGQRVTAAIMAIGSGLGLGLVTLVGAIATALSGPFPGTGGAFKRIVPDTVLDRLVLPVFRAAGRVLPALRILQQGRTHLYVLYILIVLILLLLLGPLGIPS